MEQHDVLAVRWLRVARTGGTAHPAAAAARQAELWRLRFETRTEIETRRLAVGIGRRVGGGDARQHRRRLNRLRERAVMVVRRVMKVMPAAVMMSRLSRPTAITTIIVIVMMRVMMVVRGAGRARRIAAPARGAGGRLFGFGHARWIVFYFHHS